VDEKDFGSSTNERGDRESQETSPLRTTARKPPGDFVMKEEKLEGAIKKASIGFPVKDWENIGGGSVTETSDRRKNTPSKPLKGGK